MNRIYNSIVVIMTRKETVSMRLPLLKEDTLIKVRTVTHTFRRGGPRIQHEMINNKHFFHNYGMGASAVPLSFGAATMSAKSYTIYFDPTIDATHCAVIGAGAIGLMTALELIKRGRKVTVYAASIPDLQIKQKNDVISQVMPAVWMPKDYDWSEDMLKHELMSKLSFDYLRESVNLNRYQSLKELPVIDVCNDSDQLKEVVSSYVGDLVRPALVNYQNGKSEEGSVYKTFHIDSSLYLEQIKIEAMLRGVRFVQQRFNTLKDILQLKQMAIWNCTNQASSYLFQQTSFQHQHYLLLDFERDPSNKQQFVFRGKTDEQFQMQCLSNGRHLIIKVQDTSITKQIVQKKLDKVNGLISQHNLRPKL